MRGGRCWCWWRRWWSLHWGWVLEGGREINHNCKSTSLHPTIFSRMAPLAAAVSEEAKLVRGVFRTGLGGVASLSCGRVFWRSRFSSSRRLRHSSGVFPWARGQPDRAKCMAYSPVMCPTPSQPVGEGGGGREEEGGRREDGGGGREEGGGRNRKRAGRN